MSPPALLQPGRQWPPPPPSGALLLPPAAWPQAPLAAGGVTTHPPLAFPLLQVSLLPLLCPSLSPGWLLSLRSYQMLVTAQRSILGPLLSSHSILFPVEGGVGHSCGLSGNPHPGGFWTFITRPQLSRLGWSNHWLQTVWAWVS